jgi:prophage regulatory protein
VSWLTIITFFALGGLFGAIRERRRHPRDLTSTRVPPPLIRGREDRMTELELTSDSWLRERELLRRVPFSRSTLWREVKAGRFPAPYKLSPGTSAWLWCEVLEALKGRQAQADLCSSDLGRERG